MINFALRIILTLNSTSWIIVVFGINEKWQLWGFSTLVSALGLLLIPVILSLLSIRCFSWFGSDSLGNCKDCILADNEFLPVYLGYFFVSLGLDDIQTLFFVYALVFVFTLLSQTQYFNPLFILLGFHFYHVTTVHGTQIFLIAKGKPIRNINDVHFGDLRRINDTTYISREGRS